MILSQNDWIIQLQFLIARFSSWFRKRTLVPDKLWIASLVKNCPVSVWAEDSLRVVKTILNSRRTNNSHPGYPILKWSGGNADAELVVKKMLKVGNSATVIFKVCMDFLKEVGEVM